MRRVLLVLLLVVLLIALVLAGSGCTARDEQFVSAPQPTLIEPVGVRVDTETVRRGEIFTPAIFDGAVTPYVQGLYFTIDGAIDQVNVTPGMPVKAGDVLFTLDQDALIRQIDSLSREIAYIEEELSLSAAIGEVDIKMLELELNQIRSRPAEDDAAVQSRKVDAELKEHEIVEKRASLKQSAQSVQQLELDSKMRELEYLQSKQASNSIVAPFDGRAVGTLRSTREQWKTGDWISAYDPLVFILDETRLTIKSDFVPESQVRYSSRVYAHIGANEYELKYIPIDQFEYVTAALAGLTLQTDFEIVIPEGQEDRIQAGMYAAVCLISNHVTDVLVVPTNAVQRDAMGRYVYVVDAQGVRSRRNVKTGVNTNWLTEITEGLEEGEEVYVKE